MPANILKRRLFARLTSNRLNVPRFFQKSKKGFTLVELLVVLAVIGVLATILLANYNNFGARQEVRNAAAELKTNLRKYQTFAISGQKNPTNLTAGLGCNSHDRQLDHYEIVVSSPSTYNVNIVCHEVNPPHAVTTEPVTANVPWGPNVPIAAVGAAGADCAPGGTVTIRFLPINEGVEFLSCFGAVDNVSITVGQAGGDTSVVTVTNTGQIDDN
jgi:type IV pilus assembly protein PilA